MVNVKLGHFAGASRSARGRLTADCRNVFLGYYLFKPMEVLGGGHIAVYYDIASAISFSGIALS